MDFLQNETQEIIVVHGRVHLVSLIRIVLLRTCLIEKERDFSSGPTIV